MCRHVKILIAEASNHTKCLENTYHLLESRINATFYYNRFPKGNHDVLFPSAKKANVIRNKFHSKTYFIWLLFYGRKYDYINVATGPENSHFSEIVNVIFFYFCCLAYGDKIILTIKNLRSYLKTTPGFFAFIRNKSIKKVKRFTFETETMKNCFARYVDLEKCFLGLGYDRYTDLLDKNLLEKPSSCFSNKKIKIGLLGTVNPARRDYRMLIDVLKQLTPKERDKLFIVILGKCPDEGPGNKIVKEISRYIEVDYAKGYIPPDEFDIKGTSCDFLLSPLTPSREYGNYKGSGSFGDAVYLRKKIIIPSFSDEKREFNEIALYYKSPDDLLGLFKNLNSLLKDKVNLKFIEKFSTENVYRKLVKDLKFPASC